MPHFSLSVWIDAPVEKVWRFHERDDIFELLSPPRGKPNVLSRQGKLETGAKVEFAVPLGPFQIQWLALHVDHEDNHYFVDQQVHGPFHSWKHWHLFEPENGGTRLTDRIEFLLPLSPLSDAVAGWAVKLQLRAMFRHRHKVTKELCEQP